MNARIPLPHGSIVLTPADARLLYQVAKIGELRTRYRIGDSHTYQLLTDISLCAFTPTVFADNGKLTRQETASEEPDMWTVTHLAKRSGRAQRTVRLDIEQGALPATKQGNVWVITRNDAHTYINSRRQN